MRSRTVALLAVWCAPSALFLAVTALVFSHHRLAPPAALDDVSRSQLIAPLRAALSGERAATPSVMVDADGPLFATVWSNGRPLVRLAEPVADARDVGAAAVRLAKLLAEQPAIRGLSPEARRAARVQLDLVTSRAPLGGDESIVNALAIPGIPQMRAINPGIDGIARVGDPPTQWLLPHELVGRRMITAVRPFDGVQELATGLDVKKLPGGIAGTWFRFRTIAIVEPPLGTPPATPPLALYRGNLRPPLLTATLLRARALDGARYLIAHLATDPAGRYIYEHDLAIGSQTDPKSTRPSDYSMPRHAGVTYFLAEVYRITKEPWLREPIERAFAHLVKLMDRGRCAHSLPDGIAIDCVMDVSEQRASLGSTALAVVALAEYQRATTDTRYLALTTKLANFILWMQRADGSFRHFYDPRTRQADDEEMTLYYSGEAALAMARMYAITGEPRYARSAEAALDWLVEWYDFFMGGYLYGEEHWTCIAAHALAPAVKKRSYVDFCTGYGRFLRGQQTALGDLPDADDLAGAYGATAPFLSPSNTPAGSRTEAMISTYLLTREHGAPDGEIREQIAAALQYVIGQQVTPANDFGVIGPGGGAIPQSATDRNVRIDFVQHVCSAMIRASEWIDTP